MNPYDHEQVQAVWQRVRSHGDGQSLLQALEEMISSEYAAAMAYEKLSRQNPRYGRMLLAMAQDERGHAKKLTTLYSLLGEKPPKIAPAVAREHCDFACGVRRAYGEELAAAESYLEAAQKWRQHRQIFASIAADEQRHSRNLYRIAQVQQRGG